MKSKSILFIYLSIMALMVVTAIAFPDQLTQWLDQPQLYKHVLFVHVVVTTLFFANGLVGMIWELRSLVTKSRAIVIHTYKTVSWLDARFSSLLIVLTVISGIMLSIMYGDIWQIAWLSAAFILFVISGVVWVVSDIPTQYRVKKIIGTLDPSSDHLPPPLVRILKIRLWVSLAGMTPLAIVFALMVYKPSW